MFILIDKENKKGYAGEDLGIIARISGKSVNTLRSWSKKMQYNWFENMDFILLSTSMHKSRRGGINAGNKHLFNK